MLVKAPKFRLSPMQRFVSAFILTHVFLVYAFQEDPKTFVIIRVSPNEPRD